MDEEDTRGNDFGNDRDKEASSGWVTTQQAARALGISPRTVRWHIDKGNIEAKPEGEGVKRTWIISIDSLQEFRDARQAAGELPHTDRVFVEGADRIAADGPGNPIRELADRLVEEAARAAEYRVRLELTEQAQSTLEAELSAERVRREQAEKERDELHRMLEAASEPPEEPETVTEEPEGVETPLGEDRRTWWQRWFGG